MTWNDLLNEYIATAEGAELRSNFARARETATISPNASLVFRSYSESLCPFEETKIIIIGTEPNADPALADGLCLSSKRPDFMLPETRTFYNWMKRSIFPLMNIDKFKAEVAAVNMDGLSRQGILMTNQCLTTYSGRPHAHVDNIGWEKFTKYIINRTLEIKKSQLKPMMLVVLGKNRNLGIDWHYDDSLYVEIENPSTKLKYDELDRNTRQIFIVMSNFIAEYYPEHSKKYICSLDPLIDWSKWEKHWQAFVTENNIPMPAIEANTEKKVRDAILLCADKLDLNGSAHVVVAPYISYNVGINYLLKNFEK